MQLAKAGMAPYFEGHVYSGHEMPRSKPFPDVYLAAAEALKADPARCLVIEDTMTGVQAGVAAGATVWGYFPADQGHATAEQLLEAGAACVFGDMGICPPCSTPCAGVPPALRSAKTTSTTCAEALSVPDRQRLAQLLHGLIVDHAVVQQYHALHGPAFDLLHPAARRPCP